MSEVTIIPGQLDITIYKGDTLSKILSFKDSNNVALTLNGATVTMQVRKKPGLTTEMSLSAGDGLSVSGGDVTINKVVTIAKGSYKWDMQIVYPSGIVRTYVGGDFIVEDDITRP